MFSKTKSPLTVSYHSNFHFTIPFFVFTRNLITHKQNILETYSEQSNIWKLKLLKRLTEDLDERLTYFLVRVKRFVDNFLKKNSHFPPYFFTKFAIFFLIDIFSNSIVAVYLTSRKYIDFFALLPDNLSLKILSYLDPKSLLALTKVFSELFFFDTNMNLRFLRSGRLSPKTTIYGKLMWKKQIFR